MQSPIPVITIDGPSGVGKGTLCMGLAAELGWHVLDSGAIYRALALAALRQGLDLTEETQLADLAGRLNLRFAPDGDGMGVYLDDEEISRALRMESTGNAASKAAAMPAVRQALLQRQRDFRQPPGLIADGRDMGTVVFPDAGCKLFLTASPEARWQRRVKQLKEKGISDTLNALAQQRERDQRDQARAAAPLQPAADAHVLDTSALDVEAVLAQARAWARLAGYLP